MISISHITIPFEKLERALALPEHAKIVHVEDHQQGTHAVIRIWADSMPPSLVLEPDDPLSKIGDAYRGLLKADENKTKPTLTEREPVHIDDDAVTKEEADEATQGAVVPVDV